MSSKIKVVAFGGGGLASTLLPALKQCGFSITTITSMTDSGGSTGALRKEFDIHPVGDLREHMLALSDAEAWKKDLWQFRFANTVVFEDGHRGHNFANAFMAGLETTTGDFEKTLDIAHEFMSVSGRCYPSTTEKVQLHAELENGQVVDGEDAVDVPGAERDAAIPIKRIWLSPEAEAYPKALEAIIEADYILIGPGDLYSSLLPCFLPKGIKEAAMESKAKLIYVCNLLAKPGETYNFTASDHTNRVLEYTGRTKIDCVLVADEQIGEKYIELNAEAKNYSPVIIDSEKLMQNADRLIKTDPTSIPILSDILNKIINA